MLREIIEALASHSRVFQALGGLAGLSFALAKGVYPMIEGRYSPPVATVHEFQLIPGQAGTTLRAYATLTKHRECFITTAVVEVTDYSGQVHIIENTFSKAAVPHGRRLVREFQWTPPREMARGPTGGGWYDLTYGNCRDGNNPKTGVRGTIGRIGIEEAAP
jgi:hypothetical protein